MQPAATQRLPESVEVIVLDAEGELREDIEPGEIPGYLSDKDALLWCDVSSTEGGEEGPYGRLLAETFGFDPLTVEDCFHESHLPKVDDYGSYLFVVFFALGLSGERRVRQVELDLYLGENYVVCVHPRPLRELERVRRRLVSGSAFVSSHPANVAHTVLDAVVDEYLPVMNRLSAMVDGIEEEL